MTFLEIIYPILPICGLLIIVLAIGVVASYLALKFMYRHILACPECKAKSAGEVIRTEELTLSEKIEHRGRRSVRVKVEKITDHYQCQQCQYIWTRSFNRTDRIPIDHNPRK